MVYRTTNSSTDLYKFSYDPYRLVSKVEQFLSTFASEFGLDFSIEKDTYYTFNVKEVFGDKKVFIQFKKPNTDVTFKFQFQVPELVSNGSLIVGYSAFFPLKLVDTIFSLTEVSSGVRVNARLMYVRPFDIYIREKSDDKVHLTDLNVIRGKEKLLSNLLYDEEIYNQSKDIANALNIKPKKPETVMFEKGKKLLTTMFNSTSIGKLYFRNIFELLLFGNLLTVTKLLPYSYKKDSGVSLVHKRLMYVEEMLVYSISYEIIREVMKRLQDNKSFSKQVEIAGILRNLGMYEQFTSPTAYISNIFKVDILEPFGCLYTKKVKAEAVPVNLRDIHPSYVRNYDPYTQADKEKTGVYNWLSMSAKVDEYGRFVDLLDDEYTLFGNSIYSSIHDNNIHFTPISEDIDTSSLPKFTKILYEVLQKKYSLVYDHPFYNSTVVDFISTDTEELLDELDNVEEESITETVVTTEEITTVEEEIEN